MKTVIALLLLFLPMVALAQEPPPLPPLPPGPPHGGGDVFFYRAGPELSVHGGMPPGNWWKNSEIAQQLQLTDQQRQQLEQAFVEHRMKLVDLRADVEKQEIKLQSLMDADQPAESQVMSQVDRLLTARGNLEKEFTAMTLHFRRIVTPEQWRKLQAVREKGQRVMMFNRRVHGPETAPVPPQ